MFENPNNFPHWTECERLTTILLVCALIFAWQLGVLAADPRVDHLELLGKDQVTVHFYTDANLSYTLQYTDLFSSMTNSATSTGNSLQSGGWSNLYSAPLLPFSNHFVIVDTRTKKCRIYRLKVTK